MNWHSPGAMWFASGTLLAALAAPLWTRLRASHYRRGEAASLALLALAQPAYAGAQAFQSALLAFAAIAVTASAEAFVQRQDPRRIVVLGSSLAGAQLASPVWGTITMFVLPLAIRKSLPAADAARLAGLYLSLLFIPGLMTLTLLVVSAGGWIATPSWGLVRGASSLHWTHAAFAILVTAFPLALTWRGQLSATDRIPAAVCALIVVTGAGSELFSTASPSSALQCGAAVGVVTLWAVSGWPPSPTRARRAALAVGVSPAPCWLLAIATGALHA